jgi:hypothetical protein
MEDTRETNLQLEQKIQDIKQKTEVDRFALLDDIRAEKP